MRPFPSSLTVRICYSLVRVCTDLHQWAIRTHSAQQLPCVRSTPAYTHVHGGCFRHACSDMQVGYPHWLCNAGYQLSYTDVAASCVKPATKLSNKSMTQRLVVRPADIWDRLFLGLAAGRAPGGARRQAVREGVDRGVPPGHGHRRRRHPDRCLWRTQRSLGARSPCPTLANFRTRSAASVCTWPMVFTDAPVAHTDRRALSC